MTKSSERAADSSEARQSGNPAYGSTSSHFKITLYNPSAKHKREESSAKVHVNMKVQHCYLNWNMTTTEKQRQESWPFPLPSLLGQGTELYTIMGWWIWWTTFIVSHSHVHTCRPTDSRTSVIIEQYQSFFAQLTQGALLGGCAAGDNGPGDRDVAMASRAA